MGRPVDADVDGGAGAVAAGAAVAVAAAVASQQRPAALFLCARRSDNCRCAVCRCVRAVVRPVRVCAGRGKSCVHCVRAIFCDTNIHSNMTTGLIQRVGGIVHGKGGDESGTVVPLRFCSIL